MMGIPFVDQISSVALSSIIMGMAPVLKKDAELETLLLLFSLHYIFPAQGHVDPTKFFIVTKGCCYNI